ncbi:unnamed protein product, partial [Rotaria sp. Silwood1]
GWYDRMDIERSRDIHDYLKKIILSSFNDKTSALFISECGGLDLIKSG